MIESIARFFSSGGPFMWLILAVFGAALAVIVERLIFFFGTCRDDGNGLVADVVKSLNAGQVEQARQAVLKRNAPLNNLLAVAIDRYDENLGFKEIRQGVEEVAIEEVPRYAERVSYLALFANIATLSGLLGTIFGLQQSFSSLAAAEASEKAAMLASGISQAMNTTAFGLMVAIPCLIAFAKLSDMQASRTRKLDAGSVRFLNFLESKLQTESWEDETANVKRLVSRESLEGPLSARS